MAGLTARDLEGWVPIHINWQGAKPVIDWCHLGTATFHEPFFTGTVQRALQAPFNRLFRPRTGMRELCAWAAAHPRAAPSGFIFHMSRCGSTLISQMFAALPRCVVLSEAGPVDAMAAVGARWPDLPREQGVQWLRAVVAALMPPASSGDGPHGLIKFDGPAVLDLPLIRAAYPGVPWIFNYRDPVEVLVATLREPTGFTIGGAVTRPVLDIPPQAALGMTAEEYAARVLGRLCEAAADFIESAPAGEPVRLLNYTQLPQAVWAWLPAHFGMALSADDQEKMRAAATRNAKRPGVSFVPDGEDKRRAASPAVVEAAARWIEPQYARLEQLRLRCEG